MTGWVTGGCLCGAVRYAADPDGVFDAGYCHCSMCRRASGAPVVAWALMRAASFRVTRGELRFYQSSAACRRGFCETCGTQLVYEGPEMAEMVGFHTATLDASAPAALRPRLHMCVTDRLDWFEVRDELPVFADNRLTHPDRR